MARVKEWLFDRIHARNLIYNQCWEDPAVDKQALAIGPSDRIVMITSAGCNALDYLLSGPEQIDCVDMNPHQTALLELKLAAIRRLPFSDFFALFGEGRIEGHRRIYQTRLRDLLGPQSRGIWDRRIDYFSPRGPGLYFHGTAGAVARALNWHIDRQPGLRADLASLQAIDDIGRQAEFYNSRIAPRLWSRTVRWLLRRQTTMSLLGVPAEQVREIRRSCNLDLGAFIRGRVDRVFTQIPIGSNYFWRVYINGTYTRDCCPSYLKEENFERLREECWRLHHHTMPLSAFLRRQSGPFSIYVLLDHMDWLASAERILGEEWEAILRTAAPHARVIYRSGGTSFDALPRFAADRMIFQRDVANTLHEQDRVGTYGSFYLASVRA